MNKMNHAMHSQLVDNELIESNLLDAVIYGADDAKVGTVSHLHGLGATAEVIVDVGGFLGLGTKPVALPSSELTFMRDEDGVVHATTNWTKEQIKALPEHHF